MSQEIPDFSLEAGLYENTATLSLSAESPGATIYYTLEGAKPADSTSVYSSPLEIDTTTLVRAKAMSSGVFS